MRTLRDIRIELDEATERRAQLWEELCESPNPDKSTEITALGERIAALWCELRATKAFARFGPQETILSCARTEERFEREEARRLRRAAA